ncbi:TIGR03768 family metallophosphoesterase [Desulfatirhabdium butyrativorans]|uniref:TIGR03768 family metallophosphoesterase n=1 Tax=Desulfatirhabdium butyrativorans TaxID=340467 RepID=UPI00041D89DD|nr:TIGR03768 family metallophosphoesterase [Desulfatirhabdium butyrativorans]
MKLKLGFILMVCVLCFAISGAAYAQPEPPVLSVTNGSWVYLSWSEVEGATGYILTFAPMPFTGMASVITIDVGSRRSVSGELPAGSAFYVLAQSRDESGLSQYSNVVSIIIGSYPIAADVFSTVQKTIVPVALPSNTPQITTADLSLYDVFGYSAWQEGAGLVASKRTDIMPTGYSVASVTNQAHLLNFFTMTDIHIADKESPAQGNYFGWGAAFGADASGANHSSAYSPVICYTTQVLDAAIQTVNAIHNQTPFDFGIFLGDAINNTQYNELRWYIDVLDGKEITPSSGAHLGAKTIDYQKPYRAAGLNKSIPWYQVMGNHDQFYMGTFLEDDFIRSLRIGDTIQNCGSDMNTPPGPDNHGYYMGVVDGTTPDGEIRGAGPETDFPTPPKVVADPDRHSLSTTNVENNVVSGSSTLNWMKEFFNTTSVPVGHGFTQANIDSDFACYTFEPKTDMPIRVISLDDTCKANVNSKVPYYAQGCLDQTRYDWLVSELDRGQADGMLMIIAAHVPVGAQKGLTDTTPYPIFYNPSTADPHSIKSDDQLLATLHNYPNLILWIAGHRHLNTITPQPSPDSAHPENGFWEVETASLRDFPQEFRRFNIIRNSDNTISILAIDVDPAVSEGSLAELSRSKAIGIARILGGLSSFQDVTSHANNAELVKQLSPEMQTKIANYGTPVMESN